MFTPVTGRTVLVTGGTKGIGKGIAASSRAPAPTSPSAGAIARPAAQAARDLAGARRQGLVTCMATSASPPTAERMVRRGGRAVRRHRRAVRQRRRVPRRPARGHDRAGHRRDLRDERQGHDADREGVRPRRWRPSGTRPRDPHLVDHRADHRLSRLVALRRHQGGAARLPAHGGIELAPKRITSTPCCPGTSRPRGWTSSGRSTARRWRPRSRSAGSGSVRTSATRPCSSPPTRRATSPARRSWSTAARSCPSRWWRWRA